MRQLLAVGLSDVPDVKAIDSNPSESRQSAPVNG
jgi:hypothetical protein